MGALILCANGNVNITNAVTGATYQWQQDAGSGFVNISNNANFNGVTAQTLQLTAIPSSWYGYKFRCVVNGVPGNITTLQFSNTWTGAVSNAWENPANWSCGSVPDSFTDVILNSGSMVINASTTIRSLEIQAGVNLTVGVGVTLTILH
jgi:hypothetical protein